MRQIIEQLQEYIAQEQPDFGDGRSVLTLLMRHTAIVTAWTMLRSRKIFTVSMHR